MTAATLPQNEIVIEALKTALKLSESRLLGSGKTKPGLIPKAQGKANVDALAILRDPSFQLFEVKKVSEKGAKGKPDVEVEYVSLTARGIEQLLQQCGPEERLALKETIADAHRAAFDAALLKAGEAELKGIEAQRAALGERASELVAYLDKLARDQLAGISKEQARLDALAEVLKGKKPPIIDGNNGTGDGGGKLPQPETEGEIDFKTAMCKELVFAWRDAKDEETQIEFERVMINCGIEPFGEIGESVSFDGRYHESTSDLRPGDTAVIVRSGWNFTDANHRTEQLARATVQAHGGK